MEAGSTAIGVDNIVLIMPYTGVVWAWAWGFDSCPILPYCSSGEDDVIGGLKCTNEKKTLEP
jgi:hypothetical protein